MNLMLQNAKYLLMTLRQKINLIFLAYMYDIYISSKLNIVLNINILHENICMIFFLSILSANNLFYKLI